MKLGMYKFIATTITYSELSKSDFCFKFCLLPCYDVCILVFCHVIDGFLKVFNGYSSENMPLLTQILKNSGHTEL